MDIMLGIWCAFLFFVSGVVIGRIDWRREEVKAYEQGSNPGVGDSGHEQSDTEEGQSSGRLSGILWGRKNSGMNRSRPVPGEKRIPLGWAIGSPVSGKVSYFNEGTRRGALIVPEQEILYAPAAGKITRLYPTGNAMRLRTEFGIELLIQAGIETGDLEGRYYRPRVVQNEVVNKGKPLLEFDVEGIRGEGYDPSVMMSVEEAADYRDVTVCETPNVKAGENLMWVRK